MEDIQLRVGGGYYIPFWALTSWVDVIPEKAFEPVSIVALTTSRDGLPTVSLRLSDGSKIDGVPRSYVITRHSLSEWAARISEWVASSARHILAE